MDLKKRSARRIHRRASQRSVRPSLPELPGQVMLEHLFEATLDGYILVDEQGNIVLANRQAELMFGYAPAALIGKPIAVLVPDGDRDRHDQLVADFLSDPIPRPMAARRAMQLALFARKADGGTFPVEIMLNPVQAGEQLFVLAVVRDISERQAAERERAQQAELVRLLQDVAIAANEATAVSGAIQFAVDRLRRHLGWQLGHAFLLEEDNALSPTTIWSERDQAPDHQRFGVFKAVSEALRFRPGIGLPGVAMESGQPIWVSDLQRSTGFIRVAEARDAGLSTGLMVPIVAGKKVVGVLEFYDEQNVPPDSNLLAVLPHVGVQLGRVIERRLSEEALRKQAMQLRMLMTHLPVILWMMNREGRLLLLEGKGVASSGLNPDELIGKDIFTQLSARPDLLALIKRALAGEEIHTEVLSSTGNIFETFFNPYYDVNWAVDGIVALSFDVSERKRMESELDEMKRRLMESMDSERARLAQQLHDGPLQDLYGVFYQMQEITTMLDEPGQELAGRALHTIQGVNATLRVICGELHPNTLVHLGLQRAIRGHAERLQERLEGVSIQLALDDDSPSSGSTLSPQLRLGLFRIYQQLIANAARHAQAQEIWVRLKLPARAGAAQPPEAPEAVLEVEDNGQGFQVPAQWIELVRAGHFGLVNAIERAERMSGGLRLESEPGAGTRVQVRVPIQPEDAAG